MLKNTTPNHAQGKSSTAVAALSLAIADRTGKTIQLLPAGEFRAVDGRPANMSAAANWVLDANNANELIAAAAARSNPAVIDYEHQTLLKEKTANLHPLQVGLSSSNFEMVSVCSPLTSNGRPPLHRQLLMVSIVISAP